MEPIALMLLQVGFLVLLYLFVWLIARAVIRDLRATAPASVAAPAAEPPAPPGDQGGGRWRKSKSRGTPRELVVHIPDGRPRVLRLDIADITFGRNERSTVPLNDSYASEHHARVYREGENWLVADLGSTNGTYLNKNRVSAPTPIAPGDQLAVGKTVVEVRR